jgi:DNA primase
MGRILFKEQVNELLKAGVETVNLFYDNDFRGQEAILKSYNLLATTPIKVNVVKYPIHFGIEEINPDKIPYKDANDLLRMKMFNGITVVSYEKLLLLKNCYY